jgi:hypothetical protein
VLTFGLDKAPQADRIRLVWPSGTVQELGPLASGKQYIIDEALGILSR